MKPLPDSEFEEIVRLALMRDDDNGRRVCILAQIWGQQKEGGRRGEKRRKGLASLLDWEVMKVLGGR